MPLTLIGGGSRSGKSRHALELARAHGTKLAFIATAQAYDDEMRSRIAHHQRERGPEFTTIEEPLQLTRIVQICTLYDAIVVDCLTLWLSNLMLAGQNIEAPTSEFIDAATSAVNRVIAVTNEVGCGIVPENELARRFRDEAGRMNQRVAAGAGEVYWMIFGCPLRIK